MIAKVPFEVSAALIHWPVLDGKKEIVATNVTNFDIHDIARVCRTYGLKKYHIVHRQREQLMFVGRILEHWRVGHGFKYNPSRAKALRDIELNETLDDLLKGMEKLPKIVATAAREVKGAEKISFKALREKIWAENQAENEHYLILFGTGHGLSQEVLSRCDYILEPIRGCSEDGFNHLSVRSAVSICLDRLLAP